jgi:hypothetical protein
MDWRLAFSCSLDGLRPALSCIKIAPQQISGDPRIRQLLSDCVQLAADGKRALCPSTELDLQRICLFKRSHKVTQPCDLIPETCELRAGLDDLSRSCAEKIVEAGLL